MTLMGQFCFCCSVRLGTIIVAFVSMIQAMIPLALITIVGADDIREYVFYFEQNYEYPKEGHIAVLVKYMKTDVEVFMGASITFLSVYCATCLLAVIGAYKLLKCLILPFIICEALRIALLFALHCFAMILLKKHINLGELIILTVAGSFLLLLLLYVWACAVAMFDIIIIVYSAKYRNIYGNDPLRPYPPSEAAVNADPSLRSIRPKRKVAFVETVFSVPENDQGIYRRTNDYWTMKHRYQEKSTNLFTSTNPNPVYLNHNNIFSNQNQVLQYRSVRNNVVNLKDYDYY